MSAELEGTLSTRATLEGEISIGNGTKNYNDLRNKPSINDVELEGNKTASELGFADVATSGSYDDLTDKPTIPAAQVNADWNAVDGVAKILNKPTIPAAQIQSDWNQTDDGEVDYIKNKPTIPAAQVNSDWEATDGVAEILNKPVIYTQDEVDDIIDGLLPVDEADGSVASFSTDLAKPLVSLKANVDAIQDLHGQSGAYIAGGQLWDETWELGAWSSVNGSAVNYTDRIRCKNLIPVQSDTSYSIRLGKTASCVVNAHDVNGDFIENIVTGTFGDGGRAFTTPSTCKYIKFSVGTAYGTTYKNDISINYPSTDTAYHPYSNICPIYGWNQVNVTHCRKNLFNPDYLAASGVTIQDGVVIGTAQSLYDNFGTNTEGIKQLRFKANTVYTLSFKAYTDGSYTTAGQGICFRINYTDGSYTTLAINNNQQSYGEFVKSTSANKTVDKIYIVYSSGYPNTWYLKDIQLEENTNATTFEPYNGSSALINLGDTYYGGYVTKDNNGLKLVVTHKRYDLGSMSWQVHNQGYYYSTKPDDMFKYLSTEIPAWKSEKYTAQTGQWIYGHGTTVGYIGANGGLIYATDNTTPSGYLVAPITEPIEIDLTDIPQFTTLIGTNNIFADSGDVEVKFKKSIQKYIDDKIAETQALIL